MFDLYFLNRKKYISGINYFNFAIFIPIIIIITYISLSFIIFKRSDHLHVDVDFFSFEFFPCL